jgi:hypothetical protein
MDEPSQSHCKIFQKCTHEAIEREWMVPGEILYILKSQNIKIFAGINQSVHSCHE